MQHSDWWKPRSAAEFVVQEQRDSLTRRTTIHVAQRSKTRAVVIEAIRARDATVAVDVDDPVRNSRPRPAPVEQPDAGSCARGRDAGTRHIWVADQPSREQLLETLTHEIAHGLMPWREDHTARWLQLHVATLEAFTGAAHAAAVGHVAAVQYDLR